MTPAVRRTLSLALATGMLVALLAGARLAAAGTRHGLARRSPCVFVPGGARTCSSSDREVSVDFLSDTDTSGCTFRVTVNWGDDSAPSTVQVSGGSPGPSYLASHTYSALGSYTITESGRVLSGHCAISGTSETVTLTSGRAAPANPVRGRRVVLEYVSGTVSVRVPGAAGFAALTGQLAVPNGTDVQTSGGVVRVIVLQAGRSTHSALVYGGRFVVTQSSAPPYLIVFTLSQPLTGCRHGAPSSQRAAPLLILRRPPPGPTTRHLWVDDNGGTYETATGQVSGSNVGTKWLTSQNCIASRIRVVRGTVSVFDHVDGTTTTVHAHHSYRASARERENPLGPVISYWAAINEHAFARAWAYVLPGTIGSRAAFVRSEISEGVKSASFTGVVTASTASTATIRVVHLVTVDDRFGCRVWHGTYRVVRRSVTWRIQHAGIVPRKCP